MSRWLLARSAQVAAHLHGVSPEPGDALGFREHASWALASDTLEFAGLEDITGRHRSSKELTCSPGGVELYTGADLS
jgi:hypothetical protein